MPTSDPRVIAALRFSVDAHGGQLRKDGRTPYVVHPVAVLRHLSAHLRVTDPELLCAAALHDVLEDTEVPRQALAKEFGPKVLGLVDELTLPDDVHGPTVPTAVKTRHLVEALERISWEAVLVKLCDRWDNLEDASVAAWTREKTEGYFRQTEEMLATLEARRSRFREPPGLSSSLDRGLDGVRRALAAAREALTTSL